MDEKQITNEIDVAKLDTALRKMMHELQWKTKALEEMQNELTKTRQSVYCLQTTIEDKCRDLMDKEIKLKSVMELTNQLGEENRRCQNEKTELQIKCDRALREQVMLLNQARIANMENIELKQKLQNLEMDVDNKGAVMKDLVQSLHEVEKASNNIHAAIEIKFLKLEREHKELRKTCAAIKETNNRLQALGLSTHAIHQKDKANIEELHKKLSKLEAESRINSINVEEQSVISTVYEEECSRV
ncbi:major antigen-like isoform X2 [Orussus abietinus]|uniref:major antigen-like isoform X2 n=1 Tax=Orussus abietinus TaxID=222816 RepID=UPI000C715BD2|nr:major antigen-like isoform X2 [Orussus abietinus]